MKSWHSPSVKHVMTGRQEQEPFAVSRHIVLQPKRPPPPPKKTLILTAAPTRQCTTVNDLNSKVAVVAVVVCRTYQQRGIPSKS